MVVSSAKPGKPAAAAVADGRVQRGARNHEAIVKAVYDLVRENHLPPTVEEVAERAGVGTRTVFRQFADLDTLFRSMGERVQQEVIALVTPSAPSGHLEDDLRALVGRRARIYEHITPFRRAARLVRHQSLFLREREAVVTKMFRMALEGVVLPHVGVDATSTLEALDVLLSFDAWDRLRDEQKLGARRAEAVLLEATTALCNAAIAARSTDRPRRS
jgi:AcrR family transcriptional regulator